MPPQIIARLPGLDWLNGTPVKPRERRDAELRYLQTVLSNLQHVSPDGAEYRQFARDHPELERLRTKYGWVG